MRRPKRGSRPGAGRRKKVRGSSNTLSAIDSKSLLASPPPDEIETVAQRRAHKHLDRRRDLRGSRSRRIAPPTDAARSTTAEAIYAAIVAAGDDALAEALERRAEQTGQNVLRYAGQVIRGKRLGRPLIDDRKALQRIMAWPAARRSAAAGIVARAATGPGASNRQVKTTAQRYRRKLRKISAQKGIVRQSAAV